MRSLYHSTIIAGLLLVLMIAGACQAGPDSGSNGESSGPPSKDPQAAAEQALTVFQQLVNADNFKAMGFESVEEIKSAQLGQPLTVFRVPLDKLQSFSKDQNPEDLLVDVGRVIYPVTFKEQVRSSIAVEGAGQEWRATDYGSPNLIRALTQFTQSPTDFIVQVPAFSLYFIAQRSDSGLVLTPIIDDVRFGLKAGEAIPASVIFDILVPFTRDYNGLPDG
ncbi:MAG: hypothetical protein HZB50_08505 [Chloroflexi bacterium]|nr:hypothetical protein [Chloroflexota bacterium]